MNKFLKLKNISKSYRTEKTIKVLKCLSQNFEKGKIYSIMGPSWSGKSTLLNLISLIDRPSSGSIMFDDNQINFNNTEENDVFRSKKIGIVYQQNNLLPDFTALENIYLASLARAIVNDPEIILADEPTGSLDMETAKDIFELLNKQKRSDRLIIFATHNRFFANKSDYLLEMRDGSIKSSNVWVFISKF